jgi:uncharacterized integral membrane protein
VTRAALIRNRCAAQPLSALLAKDRKMLWTILIIVLIVLVVMAIFGRGRFSR